MSSGDVILQESDIDGMRQSAKLVFKHIEAEIRGGIPSEKVILGGFSQGTPHPGLIMRLINMFRSSRGSLLRHALREASGRLYSALHHDA